MSLRKRQIARPVRYGVFTSYDHARRLDGVFTRQSALRLRRRRTVVLAVLAAILVVLAYALWRIFG